MYFFFYCTLFFTWNEDCAFCGPISYSVVVLGRLSHGQYGQAATSTGQYPNSLSCTCEHANTLNSDAEQVKHSLLNINLLALSLRAC